MAIDTPARHIYTGNGNQRVFPIPTKIIGDDYVRIEIDGVYQSDRTKWDVVNNSIIFITAPINGSTIDIQVATSEEALAVLGSSTNVDIVASNMTDVNTVANNIEEVQNAYSNSLIATAKASEASVSATAASSSASTATTKATEASVSASNASTSATTATTKASEASASATSASTSANIATTKAAEAVISASNATISETNALASEYKANKWAEEDEDVEVETGAYSAKHWAIVSQNSVGVKVVESIAELKILSNADANTIEVLGYYAKGDGGGGTFYWDSTSIETDNGGTIIQATGVTTGRWKRVYSGAVNVKWFGAKGDGITDDTLPLQSALAYCNSKIINLYISTGNYIVKDNIGFPHRIKVYGDGMSTIIYADMVSGKWVFEPTSNVNGYTIENMRFYAVNERNIGCIKADYGLRGCSINNIWSFDMEKVLYVGDLVYGAIDISNIFGYYLRTEKSTNKAIDIYGNTVFMKNIEIIGSWEYGLYANSTYVFSLRDFNIGGSSSTIQMKRAVYLDTCKFGTIETGWVEQLDDAFWANGVGEAIYCKDSSSINVSNIDIASGSLYSDNSSVNCTGIKYGQDNGGLKYINGGKITTTKDSIKFFSYNHADGECSIIDINSTSNTPIVSNPMLLQGAYDPNIVFSATNGGLVTLSRDTADYITGESSIKATVTAAFHGVRIRALSLKAGNEYTVSILAKASGGKLGLSIFNGSTTKASGKPSSLNRSDKTGVFGIYTYSVTAGVDGIIDLRLISDTPCVILIDSIQIYGGYKVEDLYSLNNDPSDNLVADHAPTLGTWKKGQILKTTNPIASGFIGWVCVVAGTPGTWKTFGAISA